MENMDKNPYIGNSNRLPDVIAAIQAMGVYRFHMCPFSMWAKRIVGDASQDACWKKVFEEHPEFFRLDTTRQRASLVWRRQFPKRYDVDHEKQLSEEEYALLSPEDRKRISRAPLSPSDIKTLIDTAIDLHSRAVEIKRESRWWVPLAVPIVSGLSGGLIGVTLGTLAKHW